jgi:curli production assembly/transport component CsgF
MNLSLPSHYSLFLKGITMLHRIQVLIRTNLVLVGMLLLTAPASATEMVYQPTNPSFGGNPMNGAVLLNSANAQNKHTAPSNYSGGYTPQTALQAFNSRLQALIMDRLASSVTSSLFDANGNFQPGTIDTTNFTITIVDLGGGVMRITTTDKSTGASTTFEVNNTP